MKVEYKRQKVGGRKAGTPNKITTDLRKRIALLIEDNFETIEADFQQLDSEKRLIVLERYLKYCLPPLHSISIAGSTNMDEIKELIQKKFPFGGLTAEHVRSQKDPKQ